MEFSFVSSNIFVSPQMYPSNKVPTFFCTKRPNVICSWLMWQQSFPLFSKIFFRKYVLIYVSSLLLRNRNRKYQVDTFYGIESIELVVWVGGSALVTNDQPSYFQPTGEMAHSIAWETAQFKGDRSSPTVSFLSPHLPNWLTVWFSPHKDQLTGVRPMQWFGGLTHWKRSRYETFPIFLHTL